MSKEMRNMMPVNVTIMGKVDSMRMWMWQRLIAMSQGHIAHAVYSAGFELMECLRRADSFADGINELEYKQVRHSYDKWARALMDARIILVRCKASQDTIRKIDSMHSDSISVWPLLSHKVYREGDENRHTKNHHQEATQCENDVPSPVASSPVSQQNSAVPSTGQASIDQKEVWQSKHSMTPEQAKKAARESAAEQRPSSRPRSRKR